MRCGVGWGGRAANSICALGWRFATMSMSRAPPVGASISQLPRPEGRSLLQDKLG